MDNLDFDIDYELMLTTLSTNNKSYNEFCENINILNNIDEYISEVVNDTTPKGIKRKAGSFWKKGWDATKKTTIGVVKSYDKITDAGGNIIKILWNLVMVVIKTIAKVIKWISDKIVNLNNAIKGLNKKAKAASTKIKNKKINNMSIYVTASDIEDLYNNKLFNRIDNYITTASKAYEKGYWNITEHNWLLFIKKQGGDIKLLNKLNKLYGEFESLDFEEESISLKDQNNIDIYFSGIKNISFIDLQGNKFNGNYYEALLQILEDLKNEIIKIKKVHNGLYTKYKNNINNKMFGNLEKSQQETIQESISNLGKTTSKLGNIFKYVMHDVKSINSIVNEVLNNDKSKIKNSDKIKENINKDPDSYKNNTNINI